MYLDTGTFQCEPRKQVPLFRCPPDYLEVYQCFEGYCRAKACAGATMEINIRHVQDVKRLLETVDREVLGWNVSLTASTVQNCDNSQKHLLDVVKSIRTGYNTNKEFCDNSQKNSIERRIIIWKLRETSI